MNAFSAPALETVARTPTLAQCVTLMDTYGMYANIRHHSLVVARVAEQLIKGLKTHTSSRPLPDERLVITGALLHDIAKTPCLENRCNHAKEGARICRQQGYEALAAIVEEHVILANYAPARYQEGHFTAGEIVYYADKRVRHNLEARLAYILEHYGAGNAQRCTLIRENFIQCQHLETYLFQWLPFSPEETGRF